MFVLTLRDWKTSEVNECLEIEGWRICVWRSGNKISIGVIDDDAQAYRVMLPDDYKPEDDQWPYK